MSPKKLDERFIRQQTAVGIVRELGKPMTLEKLGSLHRFRNHLSQTRNGNLTLRRVLSLTRLRVLARTVLRELDRRSALFR